jgi:hypothetical protein
VASCVRCGTFLCGACTELLQEAAYCADCVDWLRRNGKPSRGVQGILALGGVGILFFLLIPMVPPLLNLVAASLALWVPTRELRRIRRGEGPLRGTLQAQVARWLGAVNLAMVLFWGGLFLYLWSRSEAR